MLASGGDWGCAGGLAGFAVGLFANRGGNSSFEVGAIELCDDEHFLDSGAFFGLEFVAAGDGDGGFEGEGGGSAAHAAEDAGGNGVNAGGGGEFFEDGDQSFDVGGVVEDDSAFGGLGGHGSSAGAGREGRGIADFISQLRLVTLVSGGIGR